jgi:hypothetical protein
MPGTWVFVPLATLRPTIATSPLPILVAVVLAGSECNGAVELTLFLAIVLDVWSRRVIGGAIGERMTTEL